MKNNKQISHYIVQYSDNQGKMENLMKYHTAALDIILKKKTFCIDLGMSSHPSMMQIFYIWNHSSNLRAKTFSFFYILSEIS